MRSSFVRLVTWNIPVQTELKTDTSFKNYSNLNKMICFFVCVLASAWGQQVCRPGQYSVGKVERSGKVKEGLIGTAHADLVALYPAPGSFGWS